MMLRKHTTFLGTLVGVSVFLFLRNYRELRYYYFPSSFDFAPSSDIAFATPSIGKGNCPPMHKRGGLIIFFHLAKAGGTTIRKLLQNHGETDVRVRVKYFNSSIYGQLLSYIESSNATTSPAKKTLVVEVHDGRNAPFRTLKPLLDQLRTSAQRNGVPFFLFTTVREPISYAFSFYNYQFVRFGNARVRERGGYNEQDMLRLLPRHTQCMFYARGEMATSTRFKHLGANLSVPECVETFDDMISTFDWIGTMEDMQSSTLPMLLKMITGNSTMFVKAANRTPLRVKEVELKPANVSELGMAQLHTAIEADFILYEKVKRHFDPLDWKHCFN